MKPKLIEHTVSVVLVASVLVGLVVLIGNREASREAARMKAMEPYRQLDFIDVGDPLERALLEETLDVFHPGREAANDSLVAAIREFRQEQFSNPRYKSGVEEPGLSPVTFARLGGMYIRFIIVYIVVMVLSYRAAQSLAILRFVRMKQNMLSYFIEAYRRIANPARHRRGAAFHLQTALLVVLGFVKGVLVMILFAPAYVIAYSIRSGFDTDSYIFMIVLGVVSNGLLVYSANRFYTFLVSESRKGYVQTALVKNLNASYAWGTPDGVPYRAILQPKGLLPSHVFQHIYLNTRYQYLPSLKEHASFLITGLIIIEMALNIQGHLGYELMQSILYTRYDVVVTIILGIFLLVKATEVTVDAWFHRESRKYENAVETAG